MAYIAHARLCTAWITTNFPLRVRETRQQVRLNVTTARNIRPWAQHSGQPYVRTYMQNPRCKFSWRNKPRRIESNHLTSPSTRFSPKSQEPGARAMCTYIHVRENLAVHTHPHIHLPATQLRPIAPTPALVSKMQVQWANEDRVCGQRRRASVKPPTYAGRT